MKREDIKQGLKERHSLSMAWRATATGEMALRCMVRGPGKRLIVSRIILE
jgi:hypothetical protein